MTDDETVTSGSHVTDVKCSEW